MLGFVRSSVAGLIVFSSATSFAAEAPLPPPANTAPARTTTAKTHTTTTAAVHTLALRGEQSAIKLKPRPLHHGVFRFSSYPAAWTAAQKTGRPILIFATSQQCPYCVKMLEGTIKQKRIMSLVEGSFETVYVDRHAQPKLVEKLQIKWYPTTIVVTPSNKVVDKIEGYVAPAEFTNRIHTSLTSVAKESKLAEVTTPARK